MAWENYCWGRGYGCCGYGWCGYGCCGYGCCDALDACALPESYSWDYIHHPARYIYLRGNNDYNPGGVEAYCCFGVGVILSWIAWALCVSSVVLVALVVHAELARPGRTQSYNQMPPPQTYQPMRPSHAPPAIGVPI